MVRLTFPRIMVALIAVLLLTYAFAIAPRTTFPRRTPAGSIAAATAERSQSQSQSQSPSPSPSPSQKNPELFPPSGKTFIGVMTDEGPHDFTAVNAFTTAAKRQPQVLLFGAGWASDRFDRALFDPISGRGMLPMLAWEPWDYRLDQAARDQGFTQREVDKIRSAQPDYRLSRIARGAFDSYLRSWAEGIKSLGYPVAIRFAHEMNGNWYPWCEAVNGNRPGDYIAAWRHVHDVFRAAGATNVIWVWSPNAVWDHSTPKLAKLYPGDNYVDWLGLSGYYGSGGTSYYKSFDTIFNSTIEEIRTFSKKPLVITETAATNAIGRKAEWINETFQLLPQHKDIIGLIWFESNKELDWRIVSSRAAAAAFAQAVAAPRYDFSWSPSMIPRND
jgi:mannan endo-1,4-beta-mannosidase